MNLHFIQTIKANWRDILAFVLIGLGLAILGGCIDYVSNMFPDNGFLHLVLPTVANYVQGFSKFIGASITATLLWMLLWPRVSSDASKTFNDTFLAMLPSERLRVYLTLIIGALIAAAICFH